MFPPETTAVAALIVLGGASLGSFQGQTDALDLLKKVSETYRNLKRAYFESTVVIERSVSTMNRRMSRTTT